MCTNFGTWVQLVFLLPLDFISVQNVHCRNLEPCWMYGNFKREKVMQSLSYEIYFMDFKRELEIMKMVKEL